MSRSRTACGCTTPLRIIEEILSFSRIEAGQEEVRLETADLAELVRETAGFVEPMARNRALRFTTSLPGDNIRLLTDPGKVRQILLNLLSNALKFTDEGSGSTFTFTLPRTSETSVE
jgi:signal transduction histidine kinase